MARLALALLIVAALIACAAFVFASLRRTAEGIGNKDGTHPMQKVAYFVLIALILYVSVMGAGA